MKLSLLSLLVLTGYCMSSTSLLVKAADDMSLASVVVAAPAEVAIVSGGEDASVDSASDSIESGEAVESNESSDASDSSDAVATVSITQEEALASGLFDAASLTPANPNDVSLLHKVTIINNQPTKVIPSCIPHGASADTVKSYTLAGCSNSCDDDDDDSKSKPHKQPTKTVVKPVKTTTPAAPVTSSPTQTVTVPITVNTPSAPATAPAAPTATPEASTFIPASTTSSDTEKTTSSTVVSSSSSGVPTWLIVLLIIVLLLIVLALLAYFCFRSKSDAAMVDKLANANSVGSFESATATPVFGSPETTVDVYESTTTTTYPAGQMPSNIGEGSSSTYASPSYNSTMSKPGSTLKHGYGTASPNMFTSRA